MSNSLDPDQARQFVWPDLGPNCLQRLSAENKSPLAGTELRRLYLHTTTFVLLKNKKVNLYLTTLILGSVSINISLADKNHDFLYFRTKLGVTIAQVEDQKAYIKQLVSTEADSALIQQEKLVEHQLKKRQVCGNHLTGNNGLRKDFDTVKN